MKSLFKYKYYEIGQAELSEKVTVFKKYLLLKQLFYPQSSCLEEVPALKKYILWVIIYFGEKFLRNISSAEEVFISKK